MQVLQGTGPDISGHAGETKQIIQTYRQSALYMSMSAWKAVTTDKI